MQLKRITVTLPGALVSQLEMLRSTERISVSSVAEVALRAYLRAHDTVAGPTLRAAGANLRRREDAGAAASRSQLAARSAAPEFEEA